MSNEEYKKLHKMIKEFNNSKKIECAKKGKQVKYEAHAEKQSKIKFTVYQNRKGHRPEVENMSYILMHNSDFMVRVDLKGMPHKGIKTPHIHIFDEHHSNGTDAVSLKDIENYDTTDNEIESFVEFLKYNNFKKIIINGKLPV